MDYSVLVEGAVSRALREGGDIQARVFSAACAERMSQIFTGLRGGIPDRNRDVDLYVSSLEYLWCLDAPTGEFASRVEILEDFPEMRPSESGFTQVADIYSFYAVLVLRYALLYVVTGDGEDAVRCGHAILTAMGQHDQNVMDGALFEDEYRWQRRSLLGGRISEFDIANLREKSREASRERFIVVRDRTAR